MLDFIGDFHDAEVQLEGVFGGEERDRLGGEVEGVGVGAVGRSGGEGGELVRGSAELGLGLIQPLERDG